jgi:hypothetical protein
VSQEHYNTWNIAVQIAGVVISAIVGIVIWVYTSETKKLRQATDEQLALARAQAAAARIPFVLPTLLGFDPGGLGFTAAAVSAVLPRCSSSVQNASDEPAIYLHVVIRLEGHYFISGAAIEILRPGESQAHNREVNGPLGPAELRSVVNFEYERFPERLLLALLGGHDLSIATMYRNSRGDMFLTQREVLVKEGHFLNFAVSMVYP